MAAMQAYADKGHRKVDGWLENGAAQLIADLVGPHAVSGAAGEIGVHHGRLFILLSLLRREGERAVAIDVFEHQELNVDASGHGDRAIFEQNLARFGADRDVSVITADSTTLTADQLLDWAGGPYRVFSIDGGHTAEITENDLRLAAAVLAPGGLVILDDYYNVFWPGVSEGANRFLSAPCELVAIGAGFNKMFLTQPAHADVYRQAMKKACHRHSWRVYVQDFHGQPHVSCAQPKDAVDHARQFLRRSTTLRRVVQRVKAQRR